MESTQSINKQFLLLNKLGIYFSPYFNFFIYAYLRDKSIELLQDYNYYYIVDYKNKTCLLIVPYEYQFISKYEIKEDVCIKNKNGDILYGTQNKILNTEIFVQFIIAKIFELKDYIKLFDYMLSIQDTINTKDLFNIIKCFVIQYKVLFYNTRLMEFFVNSNFKHREELQKILDSFVVDNKGTKQFIKILTDYDINLNDDIISSIRKYLESQFVVKGGCYPSNFYLLYKNYKNEYIKLKKNKSRAGELDVTFL